MAIDILLQTKTPEKPTRHNLGDFLNSHNVPRVVCQHIDDLAKSSDLLLLTGGTARSFFKYEIKSLKPDEASLLKFQTEVNLKTFDLKDDFEKALEIGRKISKFNIDIDLIVSEALVGCFMWKLLSNKEISLETKVEKNPLRYSIISTQDSDLNLKVDVTDTVGNSRLGNYATTFDAMMLPVDRNLNIYGDSLYRKSPILGMLGKTSELKKSFDEKVSQAIAVRFITQSLITTLDDNGQEIKTVVHFGKNEEEIQNVCEWLIISLAHVIQNRGKNSDTYYKFLYTVVPNWKLFSDEIKIIIRKAFLLSQSPEPYIA